MSHSGDSDWPEGEAATHHDQENRKIGQLKRRGSSPDRSMRLDVRWTTNRRRRCETCEATDGSTSHLIERLNDELTMGVRW